MSQIYFKVASNAEELNKTYVVRTLVFCGEQKIRYALEYDNYDTFAVHILGMTKDGEPVASGRIRAGEDHLKLERIAVREDFRSQGIGGQLLDFMIKQGQAITSKKLRLHAQIPTVPFYQTRGFAETGEPFTEADIEHIAMELELPEEDSSVV